VRCVELSVALDEFSNLQGVTMSNTVFVSALTLALAVSGTAFAQSTTGAPNPPSPGAANQQEAKQQPALTIEKLTQDLQKAGFTDVKVLEDTFLIQAKTKDGNPILMTIGPNGMSALEVSNASGTGQAPTTGQAANSASPMQSGVAPLASPSKNDSRPIEDLMKAAQRLRDATHDMVREQNSTKRNDSITQVDKTLAEVEDAMVMLPTSLLLAGTNESDAKKSTENLQNAADRLNDAVKALNSDGASGRGANDVKKIKQALAQIHEEKMNVPRTVPMSGSAR
jgi:hypothetical protein